MEFVYLKLLFLVIVYTKSCYAVKYDYYWRDYTGEIPDDAVPGGLDINKKVTYIGQAFVKDGVIPVEIHAGRKWVVANIFRLHTTDTFVKILCSPLRGNFKWIPADAATLHLTTINKHLVRGGTEYGLISNVGRISYQNALIIGKVCSFTVGNAKMYFPDGAEEKSANSYEVLVYEPKNPDWNIVSME